MQNKLATLGGFLGAGGVAAYFSSHAATLLTNASNSLATGDFILHPFVSYILTFPGFFLSKSMATKVLVGSCAGIVGLSALMAAYSIQPDKALLLGINSIFAYMAAGATLSDRAFGLLDRAPKAALAKA